ncbi:MAG: phospholipase D-like domain-containing protein [Planctomycetota bacterium]
MAAGLGLAVAGAFAPRPPDPRAEALFAPTGEACGLQERLAAEIGRARVEILVAMFHMTSERLAEALAARRRAGVSVRILLDAAQAQEGWVERLRALGLDVRRVIPRGDERTRFHHKYAVFDATLVATGSYNWTVGADRFNHENIVLLREESVARAFREDFERTWRDVELARP